MGIVNGGLINTGGGGCKNGSNNSQLALSDGLACYTGSFSGVTTTSISHNLNSTSLVVEFKDVAGNLLIPDTWSITNPNVIEAEFTPAATGDVTIIACIESGLAPITGGVTTVEGLSGIVDLDSPNGSILITTSGQVINLNAIFTPASGAVLEQKCRDIEILSGLIGTGGGGGVASVNNLSGIVTLTSTNDGLQVAVNGQTIEFTSLFTSGSGQIIDQHTQDLLTLSGLIGTGDAGQTSLNGLSGVVQLASPDNSILIGDNGQIIEISGLFTPGSGALLQQKCADIDTLSGLIGIGDAGQTSINGLSGVVSVTSPDGSILVGDNGQSIELSGLFTAASGAVLQQKCQDIDTLSGLIGVGDAGQTSVNGLSGVVSLTSPDGSVLIGDNGQAIEISGLFTSTSGALLQQKCADIDILSGIVTNHMDSGQTSINGISGQVTLVATNNGIIVNNNGQAIELSTLFTYASGQLVDQNTQDILTISGLIGTTDAGQTSINGLSGVVSITSPNGSVLIGDNGQSIELSGLFTAASGAVLEQKCDDLITLSGLVDQIVSDAGQTSVNGLSGVLGLVATNNGITVTENGQDLELATLFTYTSGQIIDQKCQDVATLSGITDGLPRTQTTVNGLSGVVTLSSPNATVGININGQTIELTTTPGGGEASGFCSVHEFTPADGTTFTVNHNIGSEDFVWNMWRTDEAIDCSTIANVAPSGANHAVVQLATPSNGKLVIQGCASAGVMVGDTIAARTETGHYVASALDSAILVDASSGDSTITLPNPSGAEGKNLYVKKIDSSASLVTLNANGSGLIDGATTAILGSQYSAARVLAHNGNWWIL